ncbi:hypothetical protein ESCO_002088 [Escovopsis weberi]|uniref:NAD(P)-binding domain-containing protein n=1 Tax=Escovopsis weberi TaxID=150374 RepID=A0A0M9VWV2_ESCWE|nr:hypothetical protein ESCO_002088 [Escovopsis weberi]
MKVIVTGATGTVGKAIVQQCLQDEHITTVIILTRRAVSMDFESHPKVQVVLHQDFSQYPAEMMRGFEGAEACLWAIGGRKKMFNHDEDLCRKVNVGYTLAAADAMLRHLAGKTPDGKKFRFVFCSGGFAERNLARLLIFHAGVRRIRAEVENGLCRLADSNKDKLDVWILRPGGVVPAHTTIPTKLTRIFGGTIAATQLGKAMVLFFFTVDCVVIPCQYSFFV